MRKISLSSVIAVMITCPVFAEPSHTSGTFPGDGHMREDYTYTGAATYANMGAYSGTVNATADYTDIPYNVVAGTYLPAASETVTQCPANSYCPGLTGPTYYNANAAQGATSCPSGYPNSVAGASASTECYTACTVANANIAHATAVSGNDYNGGTDTCAATDCEDGYHVSSSIPTWPSQETDTYHYRSHNDNNNNNPNNDLSLGEWNVLWTSGTVQGALNGIASCNTTDGANTSGGTVPGNTFTNSASGQYCWCKPTIWTPSGESAQSLSADWVHSPANYNSSENCANGCAFACASYLGHVANFRSAIFGAVSGGPATCEANTITINWSDASAADIAANNAGQCTFGGDIRTPRAATRKPGKTFVGWKFQKSN